MKNLKDYKALFIPGGHGVVNDLPFYILTFLCLPGQCILDGVVSIFLPSQFKYELVLAGIIALLLEWSHSSNILGQASQAFQN